jgi:hypothetical protein
VLTKTKMALATLLVFGSTSAVLAASNNWINHRGPVAPSRHCRLSSKSATRPRTTP